MFGSVLMYENKSCRTLIDILAAVMPIALASLHRRPARECRVNECCSNETYTPERRDAQIVASPS